MPTEHFNQLTEAEAERISILAEECAEVVQVCMKIQRHGLESHNPNHERPDATPETNRHMLERELADVLHAFQRCADCGDIREFHIRSRAAAGKPGNRYLHHNGR